MSPDMESYEEILHSHGRVVVSCEEFSHNPDFNPRKCIRIGEFIQLGEHGDRIVSVLQTEPRARYATRNKTRDIKLCEIRLTEKFNVDNMTVQVTQCCDDENNANFLYDDPPNQVPCTHIIIWVKDKPGPALPYETHTILNGPDIEAIYDPDALLQWEYSDEDKSLTVAQFQTANNREKTKEKLESLVRSTTQDLENFQNDIPNEHLSWGTRADMDDMDEDDRKLYMEGLVDKKTIYENRLLEYEEQHHSDPSKIILKTMKCEEAFRFSRFTPNKSDVLPKGFLLEKHPDAIVVYGCNYMRGRQYDVMRPDVSTFIDGLNAAYRIADFESNSAELETIYRFALRTITEKSKLGKRSSLHLDGGVSVHRANVQAVSSLLLSLYSMNL